MRRADQSHHRRLVATYLGGWMLSESSSDIYTRTHLYFGSTGNHSPDADTIAGSLLSTQSFLSPLPLLSS